MTTPYGLRRATGVGSFVIELSRRLGAMGDRVSVVAPWTRGFPVAPVPDTLNRLTEIQTKRFRNFRDIFLAGGTARTLLSWRKSIDIIHAQNPHLQTAAAIITGRLMGKKVVVTFHGHLPRPTSLMRAVVLASLEHFVLRFASQVVFVSDDAKSKFGEVRGLTIRNAIDSVRFAQDQAARMDVREKLGVGRGFVVLYLNRWSPLKGIREILEAFILLHHERGNSVRLVLLGGGEPEEESYVREVIGRSGLRDSVIAPGYVDDPLPWLRASDVFALPSHNEGLPLALLEAMSVGLICIATPVGGITEVLKSGVNGLVIPEGDVDALVDAFRKSIDDPQLRNYLGEEARKTVESAHQVSRMTAEYRGIYAALIGK